MEIIREGKGAPRKILGRQKRRGGICRKMLYVVEARSEEGLLLLLTITGELVLLTKEEEEAWQGLPGDLPEVLAEFFAYHFVVPEAYDERKTVEQTRTVLGLMNRTEDIRAFTILPTTACNARCFYCYESDYPHLTMTEEVTEAVAGYICRNCGEKKARLHWFGGEPLVGQAQISRICERLREAGVEYSSHMTSNGYLFTPELVQRAAEDWKLKKIQITLDGTEEIYNRTKAYVNASGSPYQRVLDNIGLLLDANVFVSVRMNLDRHNAEDLLKLVDELAERFGGWSNLDCYAHELFEDDGFEPVRHSGDEWEEIARLQVVLEQHIAETTLCHAKRKTKLPSLRHNFCMADSPNSVTINPLGELGKCEHYAYGHKVGDVWKGVTEKEVWDGWLQHRFEDDCATCALYPDCGRLMSCPTKNPCRAELRKEKLAQVQALMLNICQEKTGGEDGDGGI